MGNSKKTGFVLQIWRSFILLILVPVILLNAAIFYMLYDMENTTKNLVRNNMEHARFLLNQSVTDSLASVEMMGSNFEIQKLANMSADMVKDNYDTIWQAKELRQNMVSVNDAYSISILCNGSNIFLTESTLCMDLIQFYPVSYSFGKVPVDKLKAYGHKTSRLTFYPYCRFTNGDSWKEGIFYTTVMTPYAGDDKGATAIVFFNNENLQGILGDIRSWDGLTYITDAEGQILYQTGNAQISPVEIPADLSEGTREISETYFGKDNFALATSISTGLQIVSVIPEGNLYMQMGSLRVFIWILNCTTILMCLLLSLMVAKRRSEVLSGALELMDYQGDQQKNVFSALYDSVSTMVDTNTSLKHALGAQKELLQSVFWSRVLSVNSLSDEKIRHLAQNAGIRTDAAGYCLLLIGFGGGTGLEAEDWNEILQTRKNVLDELRREHPEESYVGSCGLDQLVVLVPFEKDQCGDYRSCVSDRAAVLTEQMDKNRMMVCVGSMLFENLRDLYNAYTLCTSQMNLYSGYMEHREIIWCNEEELGTETTFYYTDELKNQIVLWIKTGQRELVKDGFQKILDENYMKRRISADMEPLLISKLKLTLLAAYDSRMSVNLQDVFETIDGIQTDAWLFSYILRVALDMCSHYMANIRSHEDGLQKKIEQYVDEHFAEYGFGLSVIAEHCNLSETYFSQIFKEMMGENFSAYVEKKRMAYAYKLIVETDMIIDAVAEKTGYSNTNAFRKAYKRFYGISPSQSRKGGKE